MHYTPSALKHSLALSALLFTLALLFKVGKLCEFCEGTVDNTQLMPLWLSWLPIRADVLEAQTVHAQLMRFLEAGNPHLMPALLPQVLGVIAGVVGAESAWAEEGEEEEEEEEHDQLATEDTEARMRGFLAQMQGATDKTQVAAAWGQLPAEQQQLLTDFMAS
jgi:hypothetical protein